MQFLRLQKCKMNKMKAYLIHDKDFYNECSTIVFAENRNKAKVIAMGTDCCEDCEYIDIVAKRLPEADKLYKFKSEIDWWDVETRLFLVKELGWSCGDVSLECGNCAAKEYCEMYETYKELEAENIF